FVSMETVSHQSNVELTDQIEKMLVSAGFETERCDYVDDAGVAKGNLIAKLGKGKGGLAFCSHSDTVPGQEDLWPAFNPFEEDGKLYGRGSCDMKGPLAASIIAAMQVDPDTLKKPIYIVVTADEEIGLVGARHVVAHSEILKRDRPVYGVIAEPTSMVPVYSHKGFASIKITASGRAAHTSTGLGESATLKLGPMLAYLAELDHEFRTNPRFQNADFTPPTNGLNVTINDGNTPLNVTADKAEIRISMRVMPNSDAEEAVDLIVSKADELNLESSLAMSGPLYCEPSNEIVQAALKATNVTKPETVPYGTDGMYLKNSIDNLVILGPGDIAVAHTIEEQVPIRELHQAVEVYSALIQALCQ
ncbi:MAG: M20/M25/M40 family metallo-hydrolase, partial [Chloroflexota bacterium]